MSEIAIEIENLHKSFDEFIAVHDISFSIPKGQVVGFIGANGAGKTTTMRIISTLEIPTSGQVRVLGLNALTQAAEVRQKIGWMPDHFGKYKHLSVVEYLDFFARSYGFTGEVRRERVESILSFIEMDRFRDHMMDKLSKGLTQRMGLGRALIHDPDILILDEPAAGLDPKARIDLKRLIRVLAEEGKTLFISSHILSELEEMCDNLLFINDGKMLHHGKSTDIKREHTNNISIKIELSHDLDRFYQWISDYPGAHLIKSDLRGGVVELNDHDDESRVRVLKDIVDNDFPILDFHEVSKKLEDVFVDMIEKQKVVPE